MRHHALAFLALWTAFGQAPAQEARPKADEHEDINRQFTDPNLDVGAFVKRFEDPSREVYARRAEIAAAVGLRPGQAVADVGAGTGFYAMLFAERVGREGKVYAIDIAPAFVRHIRAQAEARGLPQVEARLGKADSVPLEPGSVDVVFLCDTYHHFRDPAPILASIHRALRPGGRLVLIDFDRHKGANEFVRKHVRAPKEVFFGEVESAGFERLADAESPPLRENFFAVFRKRSQPEAGDKALPK